MAEKHQHEVERKDGRETSADEAEERRQVFTHTLTESQSVDVNIKAETETSA